MLLRGEGPGDLEAIRRVEEAAFGRAVEVAMVDAMRANGALTLSMVAESDGQIVGHIAYSPVSIDSDKGTVMILGLGPVAVTPERQKQGVGAALIRASLERLAQDGHRAVILFGHAEYYPRFGFRRASSWGLKWEHDDYPDEAFMALELVPGALAGGGGVARFRPEMGAG